jgi:hypothetical protein
MSKPSETNQPRETNQPSRSSGSKLITAGLALVAIVSLIFAGYTGLNPHTLTVTQQQLLTNTQSLYNTQTQTATSLSTVTSVQMLTQTNANYGPGSSYYQNCPYYGCAYPYPPQNYNPAYSNYYSYQPPCQANNPGSNSVSCQGFYYEASNGCTVLVIPVWNPMIQESYVYQYYTLQNLSTTYPNWTWVTVNGQIYQGTNTSPTGAACPGNYINVASISA